MGALDLAGSFPAPQRPLLVIRGLQDGTTAAHAVMTADTVASGTDTDADRLEPPAKAGTYRRQCPAWVKLRLLWKAGVD